MSKPGAQPLGRVKPRPGNLSASTFGHAVVEARLSVVEHDLGRLAARCTGSGIARGTLRIAGAAG